MRGCRLEVRLYFRVDIISKYFPELHWSLTHVKHTILSPSKVTHIEEISVYNFFYPHCHICGLKNVCLPSTMKNSQFF